jgi:hypothetical protein
MGTGSFPEVKRSGRGVDHPPPSSAEVEGRVELYICSPSGPSWPVLGRALPLPYIITQHEQDEQLQLLLLHLFYNSIISTCPYIEVADAVAIERKT